MPDDALIKGENQGTPSDPSKIQSQWDDGSYGTKRAIYLLLILCLGALASFSLASYLPPSTKNIAHSYHEGQCTAQLQPISYLQKASTTKGNPSLPASWSAAHKNRREFTSAQACAAAFTIQYESIDIDHPVSFTGATSMLSSTVQKRFFEGTETSPRDMRFDPQWQAQARKAHLKQNAQIINKAQPDTAQISQGQFLVSFRVNYKLTAKIFNTTVIQQKQLIVFLKEISSSSSASSTGWQVTDWKVKKIPSNPGISGYLNYYFHLFPY